ncbi:MAG TPA: ABC transporter ATP-binding protein [Gemmatimonadales bacterium]|nr:ABC transporter ATP-binding protein [Gemmatimonadales bacterium]
MSAGALRLERVTRRYDTGRAAVSGLTLEVDRGELVALVGASGSGKSTTLRMAAGYETPDEGRVLLDDRDITALPPQKRGFGMVFQHYALFPHMSVVENVAFGLEARGVKKAERLTRARAALASVGLGDKSQRPVQALSGGEQQRVALARALVIEPPVLLLDEPLSNLDPTLRESTRDELRQMLRRLHVTALFVTHDQEDAFAIADRVALLRDGELLQVGSPEDLYHRPGSRAVAEFIGRASLLPARDDGTDALVRAGERELRVPVVRQDRNEATARGGAGRGAAKPAEPMVVLRPESLEFAPADSAEGWRGTVLSRRFAGGITVYRVELEGGAEVEVTSWDGAVGAGENVVVKVGRGPVAMVLE